MKSFIPNGSYFRKNIYIWAWLKFTVIYFIKKLSYKLKDFFFFRNLYPRLESQEVKKKKINPSPT